MTFRSFLYSLPVVVASAMALSAEPIEIGSRLEPLVDDYLIEKLDGAALTLHKPTPREVAIVFDEPWEGNTSAYPTVFRDGDKFRMYFRGSHYDEKTRKNTHPEFVC